MSEIASTVPRGDLILSVVVPTHNRPEMLQIAIQSLARQTHKGFEIVIVDDGSEPPVQIDGSIRCDRQHIRVIRHEARAGGFAAKNTGVKVATGRLVTFLDDDDMVVPEFVERVISAFTESPALDVLFVPVTAFGRDAKFFQDGCDEAVDRLIAAAPASSALSHNEMVWLDQSVVPTLLAGVPMALQRPAFRASAFDQIGEFLPCKTMWECEWAIRAVSCLKTALLVDRLHLWRVDGQGYFTNASRRINEAEANVEIKCRLFADRSRLVPRERQCWFRKGLADAWFTLAYQRLMIEKNASASVFPWVKAMTTEFSWSRFRLVARILIVGFSGSRSLARQKV